MVVSHHATMWLLGIDFWKTIQCLYPPGENCFVLFLFLFFFGGGGVETGFLCIALAVLELTLARLASNSEIRLPQPPECRD